jgi:hypothetical protein
MVQGNKMSTTTLAVIGKYLLSFPPFLLFYFYLDMFPFGNNSESGLLQAVDRTP